MEGRRGATPVAPGCAGAAPPDCGFTLIELLVAATLFALVLAGIYRTFHTGIHARRQAEAHLDTQRSARRALGLFGDDLRNMARYQPVAFSGAADSLGFAALLRHGEQPTALHAVSYSAAADSGLVRTIQALGQAEIHRARLLAGDWRCAFLYLAERDNEQAEWVSTWEIEWGLPIAIKLELDPMGGNRLFSRVVDLPFSRR